jgi:hypothetical protein
MKNDMEWHKQLPSQHKTIVMVTTKLDKCQIKVSNHG